MYTLEILPTAKKDMDDIIYYVSNNLNNISAAKRLTNSFAESANSLLDFPFGIPIYKTVKKQTMNIEVLKSKIFLCFIL